MLKTQANIPMSELADETSEQPITQDEIDELEGQLEQTRALSVVSEQPMSVDLFERLKQKAAVYTSYTGVKPVSLEDYYNRTITVKGFVIQDITDTNEETGEVRMWQTICLKLEDDTVIGASGKGAKGLARMLIEMGFPQGDWPASLSIAVSRRKLNSTTAKNEPKYMPTFQIVG